MPVVTTAPNITEEKFEHFITSLATAGLAARCAHESPSAPAWQYDADCCTCRDAALTKYLKIIRTVVEQACRPDVRPDIESRVLEKLLYWHGQAAPPLAQRLNRLHPRTVRRYLWRAAGTTLADYYRESEAQQVTSDPFENRNDEYGKTWIERRAALAAEFRATHPEWDEKTIYLEAAYQSRWERVAHENPQWCNAKIARELETEDQRHVSRVFIETGGYLLGQNSDDSDDPQNVFDKALSKISDDRDIYDSNIREVNHEPALDWRYGEHDLQQLRGLLDATKLALNSKELYMASAGGEAIHALASRLRIGTDTVRECLARIELALQKTWQRLCKNGALGKWRLARHRQTDEASLTAAQISWLSTWGIRQRGTVPTAQPAQKCLHGLWRDENSLRDNKLPNRNCTFCTSLLPDSWGKWRCPPTCDEIKIASDPFLCVGAEFQSYFDPVVAALRAEREARDARKESSKKPLPVDSQPNHARAVQSGLWTKECLHPRTDEHSNLWYCAECAGLVLAGWLYRTSGSPDSQAPSPSEQGGNRRLLCPVSHGIQTVVDTTAIGRGKWLYTLACGCHRGRSLGRPKSRYAPYEKTVLFQ